MGLLDEAIREHLELKRKRGADPGEVSRQEHEALGPAVREAPAAEAPAPEDVPAANDVPMPGELTASGAAAPSVEPAHEPPVIDPEAPEAQPAGGPPPDPEAPAPPGEPARATEPPPRVEQETAAFDVDDVFAEEEPAEEEDVLEETPEFLQETPEHDRLWFEQKPPRDFDFDD